MLFLAINIFHVTLKTVRKAFFTTNKPASQKVHVYFLISRLLFCR